MIYWVVLNKEPAKVSYLLKHLEYLVALYTISKRVTVYFADIAANYHGDELLFSYKQLFKNDIGFRNFEGLDNRNTPIPKSPIFGDQPR